MIAPGHNGKPETVYGYEEVAIKYGVRPNRIRDLKAIAGDSSDNIPGINGIGPKYAIKLINCYDGLDGILKAVVDKEEGWPINEKFRTIMAGSIEKLKLFRNLTTIRTDCDMVLIKPEKSQKKLIKHLKKYKFVSLLSAQELGVLMKMGSRP